LAQPRHQSRPPFADFISERATRQKEAVALVPQAIGCLRRCGNLLHGYYSFAAFATSVKNPFMA
jgi:hypothetical protein